MVRVGLVARSENRGLGLIAREAYRHLTPARTLLIDMGDLARGFDTHPEWFPDATPVPWRDGTLPEQECRAWLRGVDVVLMLETPYDYRFIDWARQEGTATVLYTMPEFNRYHGDHGLPVPDVFWNPTGWRMDHLPGNTRLVPLPVAMDRFPIGAFPSWPPRSDGTLRVLHVAGHVAAGDRNGTRAFMAALRLIDGPARVTITSQDGRLPTTAQRRGVQIVRHPRGLTDYWDLYRGQDVLVLPRRYGGLSMPVQEALAAGCAVVMPDCEPNNTGYWPVDLVPCRPRFHPMHVPAGAIPTYDTPAVPLAAAVAAFHDRDYLVNRQAVARAWGCTHSWAALLPLWLTELERACR